MKVFPERLIVRPGFSIPDECLQDGGVVLQFRGPGRFRRRVRYPQMYLYTLPSGLEWVHDDASCFWVVHLRDTVQLATFQLTKPWCAMLDSERQGIVAWLHEAARHLTALDTLDAIETLQCDMHRSCYVDATAPGTVDGSQC